MKFFIERVSDYSNKKKPCENAFKVWYNESYVFRHFDSLDKWRNNFPADFKKQGIVGGGKTEDGLVYLIFKHKWFRWAIEINSLEDLLNLQKEVGEKLIIGEIDDFFAYHIDERGKFLIEIYDDYIE